MQNSQIISLAQSEGFEAAVLSADELEFDFSFRKYCEENLCGNFGTNEFCPPFCPSPEQMKAAVLESAQVLVLKSEHKVLDFSDTEKIKAAQKKHNAATLSLLNKLEERSRKIALCSPCDVEIPPQFFAHCLSAYCINVSKMAEKCGMQYAYKDGIFSLFGFITLD